MRRPAEPARPRLLDLFCGAGGAGMGYHRAGFDVVGVDIAPQSNYPFTFVQADALDYAYGLIHGFDAIHASPPCQAFSLATKHRGNDHAATHPDLIAPTRDLLEVSGKPWVMENVAGAPIRHDLCLCGEQFGLRVHRHRYFELGGGFFAMQAPHAAHALGGAIDNCQVEEGYARQVVGNYANHADASDAMGIEWMTRSELAEAIPPAYTEFIGRQLLAHVENSALKEVAVNTIEPYERPFRPLTLLTRFLENVPLSGPGAVTSSGAKHAPSAGNAGRPGTTANLERKAK